MNTRKSIKIWEEKGKRLYGGMEKILAEKNLPYHINHVSSLGSLFFTEQEVVDYTSAKSSDTKAFSEYFTLDHHFL